MTEHHLNTERREQWVVKFKATPEDADAGARAKMASMCDEAAGEPGHALSRRFKGRCLGRRSLEARSVVLRPEEANDLDSMLRALKDDVEYVERDVRLHAFPADPAAAAPAAAAAAAPAGVSTRPISASPARSSPACGALTASASVRSPWTASTRPAAGTTARACTCT